MAIQSFRHTGLEQFAKQGCTAGIQALHASRLNQLISQLSFSGGPFGETGIPQSES